MSDHQNLNDKIRGAFSRIKKTSGTTNSSIELNSTASEVENTDQSNADAYEDFKADAESRLSPDLSKQDSRVSTSKIMFAIFALSCLAIFLYLPKNEKKSAGELKPVVEGDSVITSQQSISSIPSEQTTEYGGLNEDWREFSSSNSSPSDEDGRNQPTPPKSSNDQVEGISEPIKTAKITDADRELGYLSNLPDSDIQNSSIGSAKSKQLKIEKPIQSSSSTAPNHGAMQRNQSNRTNDIQSKLNQVLDEIHSIKNSGANGASIVEAPNLILLSVARARKYCEACVAHAWINLQGVEREIGDGDIIDVNLHGLKKDFIVKIENDRLNLIDKSGVVFSYWPR